MVAIAEIRTYTHYNCGNAKWTCRWRVISEEEVARQTDRALGRLSTDAEFANYAHAVVRRWAREAR
ncbi:MAG TPA: hypothetical protein VGM37_01720 [Armatimonadota bacterium]|jgi:hypothetical protein